MSANEPITGELWKGIEQAMRIVPLDGDSKDTQVRINLAWLTEKLNAIDAVHANLERENAALKSSAAHAYASGYEYAEMDRDGWIELPKDADGVPIHIGDAVEHNGVVANVLGITFHGTTPPTVCICRGDYWVEADELHHYVPDTWERILADALGCEPYEVERDDDLMDLVARCKALCERTMSGDAE